MPRMYTARAIPITGSGDDIALHRFPLPSYGEPGWYRQITSVSHFRSGTQKGYIPKHLKGRGYDSCGWNHRANILYSVKPEDEQFREQQIMLDSLEHALGEKAPERLAEFKAKIAAVPVIEHASIFDFYDYIGFDRRKRRYINEAKP